MKIGTLPIFIFEMKHLTHLQELEVYNTKITDEEGIKHLTHLRKLYAANTNMTDDGDINHLGGPY